VLSLPEFVGSKAVTVCGEGLNDGFERVWRVEPLLGVEVLFDALNLGVEGLWDKEVGAVNEIFEEALEV